MERGIRQLDLFGDHLLISTAKAREKEEAKSKRQTGEKTVTPIPLSEREKKIVSQLNQDNYGNGDYLRTSGI